MSLVLFAHQGVEQARREMKPPSTDIRLRWSPEEMKPPSTDIRLRRSLEEMKPPSTTNIRLRWSLEALELSIRTPPGNGPLACAMDQELRSKARPGRAVGRGEAE
jgi:hypothetical protein